MMEKYKIIIRCLGIIVICTMIFCLFQGFTNKCANYLKQSFASNQQSQSSNQYISILDYGAVVGTSWQNAKDNYIAIQKAIDNNPGRQIFIPKGLYIISKTLELKNNVSLIGEHRSSTVIKAVNGGALLIKDGGISIRDLFIYGDGGVGITVTNARGTSLTDVQLQNVDIGIKLINSWNTKISNLDITINPNQFPKVAKGLVLEGQCVNNHLLNSQITATEVGVDINSSKGRSEGLMMSNVLISAAKTGLKCDGMLSLQLSNCIIDLCENLAFDINNTGGLLVSNCWIASQGKVNGNAVKLSSCWDSHFSSNNIKCDRGKSVFLIDKGSNRNVIMNNTIELVEAKNPIFILDKNSSENMIRYNNLKPAKGFKASIANGNLENSISDNVGLK
ncbi:glycosyl hydrolase family 28-related protein [Sphingobacterium siyangense]|uniref:glycosyl hydrolase family 28-related protein n=1 Tax=Sphingobacterium siyangense TaxID=459529 RepID=UPI003DA3E4E1